MSGSAKEGRESVAGTVGFIFFGVSSPLTLPFNENRTRRSLLPLFFFGRLAAGVEVGDDVVGGGLFPTTTTTGSIFSSLILTCVGIRFRFAASVSSDEMVLSELGGIVVRGAASGAKSDSGTNVDGEEGGCESLLLLLIELIILVLDEELFRTEAAASAPMGADDDVVFGSGVRGVDVWSCDDERKASTVVCVRALSSFMMCSSKRGCRNPRFEKRC